MNIGREIHRLRKAKSWTQTELAHMANVSPPTIQLIEAGRGNPSWDTVTRIFSSLGFGLVLEGRQAPVGAAEFLEIGGEVSSLKQILKKLTPGCKPEKRELDLLLSLALALVSHYPTWIRKNSNDVNVKKFIRSNTKHVESNRALKFRRLWLARLSEVI